MMKLHNINGIDIDLEHIVAVGPVETRLLEPSHFVVTTILGKDIRINHRRGEPPMPESKAFDFGSTPLGQEYYTGHEQLSAERAILVNAWRTADISIYEHVAAALGEARKL
jgi:hypothetical protein